MTDDKLSKLVPNFDLSFADTYDWAQMYRALGLQAVPACLAHPGTNWKRPNLNEWKTFSKFQCDDALAEQWFCHTGHNRSGNIGIITGVNNYLIIDLDLHKNPKAKEWWDGLMLAFNNEMPLDTPTQITGGGGLQILVRWPEGYPMPTIVTPIGVDIRGTGGFAVLAPSLHESGNRYQWIEGYEPWTTDIIDAEMWLVDAVLALQVKYGAGSGTAGQAPAVRTETPPEALNAFGRLQDGREDYMTKLVWAAVVDCYRESPIPLAGQDLEHVMREAYQRYEDGVSTRLNSAQSKAELLDTENRGYAYFKNKWVYAMKQWDTKVHDAAQFPPERDGSRFIASESSAEWSDPDLRLLQGWARNSIPFPVSIFGNSGSYISDLAASMATPVDYLAMVILTTVAGVLGDAVEVSIRDGWTEPCALWGLLVGNPSTGKSRPIDMIKRIISKIERDEQASFAPVHRAWQTKATEAADKNEKWRKEVREAVSKGWPADLMPEDAVMPPEPLPPQIAIGWSTVEKLNKMFVNSPRGLILLIDEAAVWIGNLGRYGKGNADADAPFYLSAFGGLGTQIHRVTEGADSSPARALLSACAGIQPKKLSELMSRRTEDGLDARFLKVMPDPAPVLFYTPKADPSRLETIYRKLRSIPFHTNVNGECTNRTTLSFSQEATTIFASWYVPTKTQAIHMPGPLGSMLGKAEGVVARLALVLELFQWADSGNLVPPETVSAKSVALAIDVYMEYFFPMAKRIAQDAALTGQEVDALTLLREILARKPKTINAREVYRDWSCSGLSKAGPVDAAIRVLIELDCLRAAAGQKAGAGRPLKDFDVNPKIFGGADE